MNHFELLAKVTRRIDAFAFSPSSLADRALELHFDRRRARALADPTYAAIEERRHIEGRPGAIFLSADLTLADDEEQRSIAKRITPDPLWLPLARRATEWRLTRLVYFSRHATQRLRRGWADDDSFDLQRHLAATLGPQLVHLADIAHGWPESDEFPTPEDWCHALRQHGAALINYAAGPDAALLDTWHDLATTKPVDTVQVLAARKAMDDAEDASYQAAQAALHWVADHLANLWD